MGKTKSLSRVLPAAIRCEHCKGAGKVKPMFYEHVCHACHGAGITAEDGSALSTDDAFLILLRRMGRLEDALRKAKKAGYTSSVEVDRYAGASERLGGRYVMD